MQWIFGIEQYFLATRVNEEVQRINYAASLLRGSASLWWRQTVEDRGRPASWRQFTESLRYQFVTTNTSVETRYQLSNLQQRKGHGVTEYARNCVTLCLRLRDMSEAYKIFYFVMGLRRPEVRRDTLSRNPTTLADAIRYAEISDSSLYPGGSHRIGHLYGHRPHYTPYTERRRAPSPMDLDYVSTGRPGYSGRAVLRNASLPSGRISGNRPGAVPRPDRNLKAHNYRTPNNSQRGRFQQGERSSKRGRCFKCGKMGHFARSCPNNRRTHSNFAVVTDSCECCAGEGGYVRDESWEDPQTCPEEERPHTGEESCPSEREDLDEEADYYPEHLN